MAFQRGKERGDKMDFLMVGLGGAIGAMGRYLISLIPVRQEFPILTLLTNFAGAILIGMIVGISSEGGRLSQRQILLLKTGVCGGFTTFSTFSLEAVQLLENGKTAQGILYILLSVGLCLAGVVLGRIIGHGMA